MSVAFFPLFYRVQFLLLCPGEKKGGAIETLCSTKRRPVFSSSGQGPYNLHTRRRYSAHVLNIDFSTSVCLVAV